MTSALSEAEIVGFGSMLSCYVTFSLINFKNTWISLKGFRDEQISALGYILNRMQILNSGCVSFDEKSSNDDLNKHYHFKKYTV